MDIDHEKVKKERFDLFKSIAFALFLAISCAFIVGASLFTRNLFFFVAGIVAMISNIIVIANKVAILWLSGYYYGKQVGYEQLYAEAFVKNRTERAKKEAERWRGVRHETIDI